MNAPARTAPVLRNAAGEPPLGEGGNFFRDDQGEIFHHAVEAYRSPSTTIGILELESGQWLAKPPSFHITRLSHDTREAALRAAISSLVRRARKYMGNKEGEGTHWNEGYAGRVIEWALSLKPVNAKTKEVISNLFQAASAVAEAPIDHPVSEVAAGIDDRVIEDSQPPHSGSLNQPLPSDPIITELMAAKRARKTYPSGHTFAMTNPVILGQMKTVGTCECGHVFAYTWGCYERMDAAIEAHWQKFDATADKIDGRGQPIGEAAPAPKPKHQRKRKQPDAPEGIPASSEPAPSPPPDGAGSLVEQAAPIGAGSLAHDLAAEPAEDWGPLLNAALDLAWREPVKVTEVQAALLDFGKVYALRGAEVERPPLRWHGSKWRLAPWIISHFPDHRVYVEPFGGGASVLLRKRRSYAEIYNDLDREVVSFFRILQDPQRSSRLIELLYLTPFAREEFELGYKETDDPIESARRLVVRAFMGHGSDSMAGVISGFRANSNKSGTTPAHDWANYTGALPLAIERMRGVVVEQREATKVMETHDAVTTLHYVDPPYLPETRSWMSSGKGKGNYRHELDPEGHTSLLSSLLALKGMVVLSGYPSEMYEAALGGWRRVEIGAFADGARPRTEVLWLNPACAAILDQQMPALFDLAAHDVANAPPPQRRTSGGGN